MTYSTLQVNDENIRTTFLEDQIGRNEDLMSFVATIHQLAGGKSIALDSPWGSGKTFFVKQAAMILKNEAKLHFGDGVPAHDSVDEKVKEKWKTVVSNSKDVRELLNGTETAFVPVYYDAWAHDNDENAAVSLIYAMLQEVDADFSFLRESEERLLTIFKKVVNLFAPQKIKDIFDFFSSETTSMDLLFQSAKTQQTIEELMHELVCELISEKANQLIIFVDELDRCKPSYAVQLLEQIKHYMNDERITFVFSVNVDQLQHTICHHYGEKFDAIGYLERFFDLRVQLPEVNREKFYRSIGFQAGRYWNVQLQDLIIKHFRFSMREMPKYLNSVEQALGDMAKSGHSLQHSFYIEETQIYYYLLVPFLIGLNLKSENQYREFIQGGNSQQLVDFLLLWGSRHVFFTPLLNDGETFGSPKDPDLKLVNLEDKLVTLYKAIFLEHYYSSAEEIVIGKCSVTYRTKSDLLKKVGMLSLG